MKTYPLTTKDAAAAKAWQGLIESNQDPYGLGCLEVASKLGKNLDGDMTPADAEKAAVKGSGITGYMMGVIANVIYRLHPRGEEFKKYFNAEQGADPDADGVVNPAIMTVGGKKMRKNQKGYIDSEVMFGLVVVTIIGMLLFAVLFVRFKLSNETVSGIAYNTTHNRFISDATKFSVRAGENTPVTEENKSTYCLPPNSQYKDLVTKAAEDKRIKIVVTAKKYFAIQAPWTCNPNVTVTEVK